MTRARDVVPSMFHRRLILLMGCFLLAVAVLAVQAFWLTVVQGAELRDQAESRLQSTRWTETLRGRILDRQGRVLALDEASFDVLVDYTVITERWAQTSAREDARDAHDDEWDKLDEAARRARVERLIPRYTQRLDAMWDELAFILDIPRQELDDRRRAIIRRIQPMAWHVRERQRAAREQTLNQDRDQPVRVELADVAMPVAEERRPHPIARGIDEQTAHAIRRMALDIHRFPGITVRPSGRRAYPLSDFDVTLDRGGFPKPLLRENDQQFQRVRVEGVATAIVGWMRGVQKEDFDRRPARRDDGSLDPAHYQQRDLAGAVGIEWMCEDLLRGERGLVRRQLDSGSEQASPAQPGQDVRTTIDIALQARVRALMAPEVGLAVMQPWHAGTQGLTLPVGTPLNGAAAVIEIDTAEILALVSTPSYTREQFQQNSRELARDRVNAPLIHRAIEKPYPPGSVVKPLVLCAAVSDGLLSLGEHIECRGKLFPDSPAEAFRCWIYKQYGRTHSSDFGGPLDAQRAIEVSCNVFFYNLGQRLGFDRIVRWYQRFGVGDDHELALSPARPAYPGNAGQKLTPEPPQIQDAIFMAIGQGPIAWTPLHAADAYATLARGGVRIAPRLLTHQRPRGEDLRLDPDAVAQSLEGLRRAVAGDFGTGRWLIDPADGTREPIFNAPGVTVWGKTGTAEAPVIYGEDPDDEGPLPPPVLRRGDHSWFVVLVGPEGGIPKYAIAVVMDYAGSGGRVSGPIANQIIRALQAEGYL